MAKLYFNLIKAGLKKIDDVPSVWKEAAQTLLDEDAAKALLETDVEGGL